MKYVSVTTAALLLVLAPHQVLARAELKPPRSLILTGAEPDSPVYQSRPLVEGARVYVSVDTRRFVFPSGGEKDGVARYTLCVREGPGVDRCYPLRRVGRTAGAWITMPVGVEWFRIRFHAITRGGRVAWCTPTGKYHTFPVQSWKAPSLLTFDEHDFVPQATSPLVGGELLLVDYAMARLYAEQLGFDPRGRRVRLSDQLPLEPDQDGRPRWRSVYAHATFYDQDGVPVGEARQAVINGMTWEPMVQRAYLRIPENASQVRLRFEVIHHTRVGKGLPVACDSRAAGSDSGYVYDVRPPGPRVCGTVLPAGTRGVTGRITGTVLPDRKRTRAPR